MSVVFPDLDEYNRWLRAVRQVEEWQSGGTHRTTQESAPPPLTVLIQPNSVITDGTPPPTEPGVVLASPVFRNLEQTDPTQPDAWIKVGYPDQINDYLVEAYGPNRELLTVGKLYPARVTGSSTVQPFRVRAEVQIGGGGGSGMIVVRPTAAGAGDGAYADAVIQVRNLSTGVWEDTSPAEHVQFRPYWTGMKQKIGLLWRCEDTGITDPGFSPARRKLEGVIPPQVKRQVQIGCSSTGAPLFANIWVPDVN